MMTKTEFFDLEISDYLTDIESIQGYLDGCLEEGGISLLLKAIGDVAKAKGMSGIAKETGLTRASLYKSLSEIGSPAIQTVDKVLHSLGFRLAIERKDHAQEKASPIAGVSKVEIPIVQAIGARKRGITTYARTGHMVAATSKRGVALSENKKGPPDYRNAGTGQVVKPGYAKTHPKTTEKEHNRAHPKKK